MEIPAEDPAFLALVETLRLAFARRLSGARPGAHRGRWAGSEGAFADLAPLARQPDPRRLDARRSIIDPFGEIQIRRFATPTVATVWVVADLSASLGATGATDRQALAALLAAALAGAARLAGDTAALAVAQGAEAETLFPPGRDRGQADAFRAALSEIGPAGQGIDGLAALADAIPTRRALVFLISDFEFPPEALAEMLAAYDGHALIPLWLRDSGLEAPAEGIGRLPRLVRLRDPETGVARSAVLTGRRVRAWARARAETRMALAATFHRLGRDPVEILDRIGITTLGEELARRRA